MLIVLIVIGLICLILLVFLAIVLSTLRIEISNLEMGVEECAKVKGRIGNYLIIINLYLFDKIRMFSIKINETRAKKIEEGKLLKWIDKKIGIKIEEELKDLSKLILKQRKRIFNKQTWKHIKELDLKFSEFKININVGTEDAAITSYLTAIIASSISILLAYSIKKFEKEKYSYKVTPSYINQNFLKLDLNCIINVKMVHIMNIIYLLLRKRSGKVNDRTSNRRTYVHSYGQYPRHG